MGLFTPARDMALFRDAYLIDTARLARPLEVALAAPAGDLIDALLDRVLLMGRSLHEVRQHTFALFAGERCGAFVVAPSEPFHDGIVASLRDLLADFGEVRTGADEPLDACGLCPLLAYEAGRVSFFDSPGTRRWLALAGRRGLRILGATLAHEPLVDLEIE